VRLREIGRMVGGGTAGDGRRHWRWLHCLAFVRRCLGGRGGGKSFGRERERENENENENHAVLVLVLNFFFIFYFLIGWLTQVGLTSQNAEKSRIDCYSVALPKTKIRSFMWSNRKKLNQSCLFLGHHYYEGT
jgi:hypothetical protein